MPTEMITTHWDCCNNLQTGLPTSSFVTSKSLFTEQPERLFLNQKPDHVWSPDYSQGKSPKSIMWFTRPFQIWGMQMSSVSYLNSGWTLILCPLTFLKSLKIPCSLLLSCRDYRNLRNRVSFSHWSRRPQISGRNHGWTSGWFWASASSIPLASFSRSQMKATDNAITF